MKTASSAESSLINLVSEFILADRNVLSAVVFGSTVKGGRISEDASRCGSDIDLHIIVSDAKWAKKVKWNELVGARRIDSYWIHSFRPASGGVEKWTIVYEIGQLDLVVVPIGMARIARLGVALGLHRRVEKLSSAMNEMASCLHGGYCFLKGEETWARFYASVFSLPGVRLSNREIEDMANRAVCDCIWILQKLSGGEIVAAQRVLHTRVVEANFLLWREMRLRRSLPLLAFGPGRKVELHSDQLAVAAISVNSLATREGIREATWGALTGLQELVGLIGLSWIIPLPVTRLFNRI